MYKLSCDDAFSSVNKQLSLFILLQSGQFMLRHWKWHLRPAVLNDTQIFSLFFNKRPAVIRPYRSDFFEIINKRNGPSIQ